MHSRDNWNEPSVPGLGAFEYTSLSSFLLYDVIFYMR